MSALTDTKIISLLERLSVVAPERCEDTGFPSFAIRALAMLCEGDWVVVATLYKDGWEFTAPIIHYAVLEEAHARGWYSDGCYSWWALYNGKIASAQVDVQIEGQLAFVVVDPNATSLLELEILPRLECLVLALETKGRAM